MRSNLESGRRSGMRDVHNKFRPLIQTLGAAMTMDADMPNVMFIDPGGAARDVDLPAEAEGLWFEITNTGSFGEPMSIYEDSGTTIQCIIEAGETARLISDGTSWWAGVSGKGAKSPVQLTDANYTVLAANSGRDHLVPNVSADRTVTLPAEAAGLHFRFIFQTIVADGHDVIFVTTGNSNYFIGGIIHLDADAGTGADELVPEQPDGNSESSLQINLPDVGTVVEFWCHDGTLWTVSGLALSATKPAFADQ